MVERYLQFCKDLHVTPNSGVLAELEEDENSLQADRLSFRLNYLGDRGTQAILCMLLSNSHLKYLNLSKQGIHTTGAQAITATFYHHPSLANLDLSHNRISSLGAKALRKLAEDNENLLTLNLEGNDVEFHLLANIENVLEKKQRGPARLTSLQLRPLDLPIPTEIEETESLAPPAFTPAESSQSLLSSRAISQMQEYSYASLPPKIPSRSPEDGSSIREEIEHLPLPPELNDLTFPRDPYAFEIQESGDSDDGIPYGRICMTVCLLCIGTSLIVCGFVIEFKSPMPAEGVPFWVIGFLVLIPAVYCTYELLRVWNASTPLERRRILQEIPDF